MVMFSFFLLKKRKRKRVEHFFFGAFVEIPLRNSGSTAGSMSFWTKTRTEEAADDRA